MAKKKKTRKAKTLADTRHREYIVEPLQQIKPVKPELNEPRQQAIITSEYNYLYSDLLKTLILTISVIVVEIVLRYFVFGA